MHFCSYLHEDTNLPSDLRTALEDELYSAFYLADDATTAVDTASDEENNQPNSVRALKFAIRKIVHRARFLHLTRQNDQLAERVAHDAVQWCGNLWVQAEDQKKTNAERQLINRLAHAVSDSDSVQSATAHEGLQTAIEHAARVPELTHSVSVVRTLSRAAQVAPSVERAQRMIEERAALRALQEQWTALVEKRELDRELSFLHRSLLPYIRTLNDQVPGLYRYLHTIHNLFGESRRLWDLLPGSWQNVDVGPVEKYSDIVEQEPSIRALARLLGRGREQSEREPLVEEQVVQRFIPYVGSPGRSEINGIRFGNDITSLLPSEIALLASPDTEMLFFKRFAEAELLCLAYTTEITYYRSERRKETVRKMRAEEKGPIIMCLDTSGSMAGIPERVSKALTLAILKIAVNEGRAAYLISFSDRIMAIDMSDPQTSFAELCEFMGKAFHGGTDLRPALNETLALLNTNHFERADVLIVSDFRIPKILDRHIDRIKAQQRRRGTRFYSLTVNRTAVYDPFNIFDRAWLYDISDASRPGIPMRSLTPL